MDGKYNVPETEGTEACAVINVGDIVFSKAGRDSGRYYIVMETEENFAYICDGDLHKTDKPKKKKMKHLKNTGHKSEFVLSKLEGGVKVTNTELRREIAEMNFLL